jgi:hypothetical protein
MVLHGTLGPYVRDAFREGGAAPRAYLASLSHSFPSVLVKSIASL